MTTPASRSTPPSSQPASEPYDVPEAKDLLALFRLAAMDGYNTKPVSTVDDWMDEARKRVLLLYLAAAAHPVSPSVPALPDSDTRLKKLLDRLLSDGPTIDGANLLEWMRGDFEDYPRNRAAIESFFAQQEARIRELTEKVKQTQAAFQASRNHYEPLVASLSSQIERLKEDSLTAEEMQMLVEVIRLYGNAQSVSYGLSTEGRLLEGIENKLLRRPSNPDTPK